METFEIEKELLDALNVHALIRIKDRSGFFDSTHRRLGMMLEIMSNCEVCINYLGITPDIIVSLKNPSIFSCLDSSPSVDRHSYEPFYREVIRVGLLVEKLSLMIDPNARIEIDYPTRKEILGREVSKYDEFKRNLQKESSGEKLQGKISEETNEKIKSFLDLVIPPQNRMLGTCYWIGNMQKTILRYGFNVEWESSSEREPNMIID